jgi:uncharacterized protein (TIGR03083 family)
MPTRLPSTHVNAESRNADARPDHPTEWYVDHLLADVDRFAVAIEIGPLDAPISACPGWDLARLTEHLGQIHRWARFCAVNGRRPDADESAMLESFDPRRPAAWLRDGAAALADALRGLDPDGPTWHPFPVDRVARVWPRRQAHETSVHRWDAERAVGAPTPIAPELASDGIDEYFEIAIPRLVAREQVALPTGSLHVHCTDVAGEWLVTTDATGAYRMVREHQKGDAALRGPAEAIVLRLWGRESGRADELSPVGDTAVLEAWLAIAGM